MLPRKNRLKLKKKNPAKFTKRIAGNGLVLTYRQTEGKLKIAVIVAKTTAKKAVERNRIRRITTEAISKLKVQNLELVIIVKENIASLKTEEVKKRLESILKKIV